MSANTFGNRFKILSFGESHGPALGAVIDGCPSKVEFDEALLKKELARRRPGQKNSDLSIVSDRQEQDTPEVLSGVFEGRTLGTPIAIIVKNKDARSQDYENIKKSPRRGHADDTWQTKFEHTDHRGGGRSSGRETLARVIGGTVAQMVLKKTNPELQVIGLATQIGLVKLSAVEISQLESKIGHSSEVDAFSARFPHHEKNMQIEEMLLNAKQEGKSYGGEVLLLIKNPPKGLGQPVFHKLKADLAAAFMGIGATAGVELGSGRDAISQEGSAFHGSEDQSQYGGIRGGISTGETISFRIFFKPTATVLDTATKGRHDPCIIPRAIPVLEAMAWMVIADHVLWQRTDQI